MKLTYAQWKIYLRQKLSGHISKKSEDWLVAFIDKLLKTQKTMLEKKFKEDKGNRVKKLL